MLSRELASTSPGPAASTDARSSTWPATLSYPAPPSRAAASAAISTSPASTTSRSSGNTAPAHSSKRPRKPMLTAPRTCPAVNSAGRRTSSSTAPASWRAKTSAIGSRARSCPGTTSPGSGRLFPAPELLISTGTPPPAPRTRPDRHCPGASCGHLSCAAVGGEPSPSPRAVPGRAKNAPASRHRPPSSAGLRRRPPPGPLPSAQHAPGPGAPNGGIHPVLDPPGHSQTRAMTEGTHNSAVPGDSTRGPGGEPAPAAGLMRAA